MKIIRSSRLFEIIYMLINKENVTAKDLAEHFEVSERTIYRDIDALSSSGIPIYCTRGRNGGIYIMNNYVLNKSLFTESEQSDILTTLKSFQATGFKENDELLEKLSAVFNKNITDWIRIDFSDWSYRENNYFDIIRQSLIKRKVVEFEYYNRIGQKQARQVEPLQLYFKSKAWYLKGFCLLRKDYRLFKLTRIKDLRPTEIDCTKWLKDECEYDVMENPIPGVEIKLKINAKQAYRVYDEFDWKGIAADSDGNFIISLNAFVDGWLIGTILSYGGDIEVLEPLSLKTLVISELKKSLENYLK